MLRRHDVLIRGLSESKRIYTLDQSFFDSIDTEQKAYVLGIWMADGCNHENEGVISLALTDLDILTAVRDVMGANNPFYSRPPIIGKTCHQFKLQSRHLSQTLARQGCPQRKTLITTFPTSGIVPRHLLNAFCRGYADGDGCIHIRKKSGNKVVHILGTEQFLKGMAALFDFKTFVRQRHKQKIWFFAIYRLEDVHRFRDWLYHEATIFLTRKRDQYYRSLAAA
jgi:hypothetical protein